MSRGLGLGWWSVAYDMLPVARCAAEERRNVRIASDFSAAIRSLGFCLATAGALERARLHGFVRGLFGDGTWKPNVIGDAAPKMNLTRERARAAEAAEGRGTGGGR